MPYAHSRVRKSHPSTSASFTPMWGTVRDGPPHRLRLPRIVTADCPRPARSRVDAPVAPARGPVFWADSAASYADWPTLSLSRSAAEASWASLSPLGRLGRFLENGRSPNRERITPPIQVPVGWMISTTAIRKGVFLSANSGSRPMERSFDDSNIPSTIVLRWKLLSTF